MPCTARSVTRASFGFARRLPVVLRLGLGVVSVEMPATGSSDGEPAVHATITSAVMIAMPTSVATSTPPWTRRRCLVCAVRRARIDCTSTGATYRELNSSTYSWPSRPRYSAYVRRKPLMYESPGSRSNRSSSSACRYLPRIFVPLSISGKSRLLRRRASRRLEPISNTSSSVDRLGRKSVQQLVHAYRQCCSEREVDAERAEQAAEPRDTASSHASDRPLRPAPRRAREQQRHEPEQERGNRRPARMQQLDVAVVRCTQSPPARSRPRAGRRPPPAMPSRSAGYCFL